MTGLADGLREDGGRVWNPGWTSHSNWVEDGTFETMETGEQGLGGDKEGSLGHTEWISGDYDTFSCQMEKLKRQFGIFLVEPIR